MTRPDGPEVTSYAGAIASILASLTLTDLGVIVGIFTAIATLVLNWWIKRGDVKRAERDERRAEEVHQARMNLLARGIDVQ